MTVVIEGPETEDVFDALSALGCETIQSYGSHDRRRFKV